LLSDPENSMSLLLTNANRIFNARTLGPRVTFWRRATICLIGRHPRETHGSVGIVQRLVLHYAPKVFLVAFGLFCCLKGLLLAPDPPAITSRAELSTQTALGAI
jgi:hypothetical protein